MFIKCWGTRGSIPSPGDKTHIYGGNTTCFEVVDNSENKIVIDAGSGIRNLGKELLKGEKKDINLLFTHVHWDHILGFPFFVPAYSDKYRVLVHGSENTKKSFKKILKHQMQSPYFPVDFDLLNANFNYISGLPKFKNSNLLVEEIPLSHPDGGFGYKFKEDNKIMVFLTDNELSYKHPNGVTYNEYVDFCKNADILLHDSQYTDSEYLNTKGWGHSTYNDVVKLALEANVKVLGLIHHDPDRSDEELDSIVKEINNELKASGKTLQCIGIKEGSIYKP